MINKGTVRKIQNQIIKNPLRLEGTIQAIKNLIQFSLHNVDAWLFIGWIVFKRAQWINKRAFS